MPSPFPGMDPWLESAELFPDLHATLIVYLRDALNERLPAHYVASTATLVWVDPETHRVPDVSTFGSPRPGRGEWELQPFVDAGMVAVLAERTPEPWEQPYLEITSIEGERLVTAIEILSASNKKKGDAGQRAYRDKIDEFRLGNVNVVEVDLLRAGTHATLVPLPRLKAVQANFDYHVCTTLSGQADRHQVKAFALNEPLPPLVVPLDPGVPPVRIELQPLFDRAYDAGRSALKVKYAQKQPDPPLTPLQQAWADELLRAKGLKN